MEFIKQNISYFFIGIVVLLIVVFTFMIIIMVKQKKLIKKYEIFMSGEDGKSLEQEIMRRFIEIDTIKKSQDIVTEHIKQIDETLVGTYQKVGVVKYDAFKEVGGKLSFALAMLNDANDGFIMNSMHSGREGCYTYVKEIIKGESFVVLSEEEKQALTAALEIKNYMK